MKTPVDLENEYPKLIQWIDDSLRPPPPGKTFWESELLRVMDIVEVQPEKIAYKLKIEDHYCSRYIISLIYLYELCCT